MSVLAAPILPQIDGSWVSSPDYEPHRKESYVAFCSFDANCNTCKHLERIKHPKCPHGMLWGKCKSKPINHPYKIRDGVIMFHPHDCMLMKCYENRYEQI